jgi:Enterobacterial TraT complement resistance protein.
MNLKRVLVLCMLCLFMNGCAAMQLAIEKKDLKVDTIMSDTIFLDIEDQPSRSVYVDVRNTTDQNINIQNRIENMLVNRGYTISKDVKSAGYLLQVNVLHVGMTNPSAYQKAVQDGPFGYPAYGGMVAGGAVGAGVGALARGSSGALVGLGVGAAVGGLADLVANALVKDVTYSMVTDVLISEKTTGKVTESQSANIARGKSTTTNQTVDKKSNRARYSTRIGTAANQVNLKFEEAQPVIEENLARSIAGIF